MKVSIQVKGLDSVTALFGRYAGQISFATANALTTTAHAVRKDGGTKLERALDRPRPYTTRQALQVIAATKDTLTATVGLGVKIDSPSKGTPYEKALGHLFTGGKREWKKVEAAFRRIGILPAGWIIVPGAGCTLDQYGNIPRSLLVQLISYFNAFTEQGYRANMSDRRRRQLAKIGRTESGYKTINGVQYFISYGNRGRQGDRYTNGRFDQHLSSGIWARSGIHGSQVKPVLMFVRMGTAMFFEHVWAKASALLFIRGRLHFHHVNGKRAKANGGAPSVLVAYGERNVAALRNCGIDGQLVMLD